MRPLFIALGLCLASAGALFFSTLTYALRELSRVRLGEFLEERGQSQWLEPTTEHANDLIFVTAAGRLLSNVFTVVLVIMALEQWRPGVRYTLAVIVSTIISLFLSVAIPHALARHEGDKIVGVFAPFLDVVWRLMKPVTTLMHLIDDVVRRATGGSVETEPEEIQQEILSVVEEGEKEGIVDAQERVMIESVIQFRDTTAGQIMTPRPEIIGLDVNSSLIHVKQTIEESGHSRIPVYDGTIDHIVGVLYARDMLQYLGQAAPHFDLRSAMRPKLEVPETKLVRELLRDFRVQKVHIAIVLDEYGGTAGIVTIEDILEELVGDISDEHESIEPGLFKRIDEQTAEADARIYIEEFNRLAGLNLPEEAGYDTLGGFVSTHLGRIPEAGTTFEYGGARFTVVEAEPQKVNRVRVEMLPQPAESAPLTPAPTSGV